MYTVMPATLASCGCRRRITPVASRLRALFGTMLMRSRPLLSVVLTPSTPMNEDTLSTAGSFSSTWARACCRCAMAAKDTDCGASVMPWMSPVSWGGKKPLGMKTYRITVRIRVPIATSSVMRWRSSTQVSERP